jgi:hypothetical protein
MLDRLTETIVRQGIPLAYVTGDPPNPLLTFQDVATTQQRDSAAQIVATFNWSIETHTQWLLTKSYEIASGYLNITTDEVRVLRALVIVLIGEINSLRTWTRNFKAETAAATNLSNFQSRVATLATLTNRTAAEARQAIQEQINSGASDQ